jgi:hypothetical protein
MTEPRESEWQRVLNCVRTLTGKDMTVGEMADACNTDAGAIVAALEELGVVPEHVVHPVLLGGWWLLKPQSQGGPDEVAR